MYIATLLCSQLDKFTVFWNAENLMQYRFKIGESFSSIILEYT